MKDKTAKTNEIFARTLNVPFTPCPPLRFRVDNLDVDSGDAFTLTNFARVERGRRARRAAAAAPAPAAGLVPRACDPRAGARR